MESSKKVVVGLSGGVDSSVAAALLKDEGYHVEGAFIVPWSPEWLPCTWREERLDAMRVAAHLGIPFHTVDLSKEYERDVVGYLVREYEAGRTPNPDIMCNKHIKFGAFFAWARERGFDFVATGHYAKVRSTSRKIKVQNEKCKMETDDSDEAPIVRLSTYELVSSQDAAKDQTYFLWTLTQEHLAHTLFPVGGYEKRDVRALAARYGLQTATKKDSQGICFLGKLDMKEFLRHYVKTEQGAVLNEAGETIGTHDGALLYTLGERHGFTVTKKTPHDPPLYVVGKDVERNTLTVAPRARDTSGKGIAIKLTDTNWISGTPIPYNLSPINYCARLRHRQPLFSVRLEQCAEHTATVVPEAPQAYVAPGQSLVLYEGEVCVGGGVIACSG